MAQDPFADVAFDDEEDPFADIADEGLPVGNTTPYTPAPKPMMGRGGPMAELSPSGEVVAKQAPLSKAKQTAADRGVKIDAPQLPFKESFKAGLASNKEERDSYIKAYIEGLYKAQDKPIPEMRVGPDTNEVEYFDGDRWVLAEPQASEGLAEAPEILFSSAGALAGAKAGTLGGPAAPVTVPIGAIIGTFIGQMAGDTARQGLGKASGINQEQTLGTMVDQSMPDAYTAAAFEAGGQLAYGAYRGGKAWWTGRQVATPAQAQEILTSHKRTQMLIDRVNKEVGGIFQPTTAERAAFSGSEAGEQLKAAQDTYRDSMYIGHDIASRQERNERAAAMYYDNVTLNQRLAGSESAEQGGRALRNAMDQEKRDASSALQGVGNNPPTAGQAGGALREGLEKQYTSIRQATDAAYANYDTLAKKSAKTGLSTIEVPWSKEVLAQQRNLARAIERSPYARAKQGKSALILDTENPMNLADLDELLKTVRDDLRRAKSGKSDLPFSKLDAQRLEASLEGMRNQYLQANHPDVYDALTKAETAQKFESDTFKRAATRGLLKPDGAGGYTLSDAAVIGRIFKSGDARAAAEMSDILGSNPEAKLQAQEFLVGLYRRYVDPKHTLIPDTNRHKEFMRKYGDTIKQFFTKEQQDKIKTIGGLAEVVATARGKKDLLDRALLSRFKGKINNMSSEELVEAVTSGKFDLQEVRDLHTIARQYGQDVIDHWKSGISGDLRKRLMKDEKLDYNQVVKLVDDYDQMAKYREVFGSSFSKNLEDLRDILKMIQPSQRNIHKYTKSSLLTDLVRFAYASPLTQAGRGVTLGQSARARSFHFKLAAALDDPAELSKLVSRSKRTLQRQAQIAGVGAGAAALIDEDQRRD
jgi:hypothetical protein